MRLHPNWISTRSALKNSQVRNGDSTECNTATEKRRGEREKRKKVVSKKKERLECHIFLFLFLLFPHTQTVSQLRGGVSVSSSSSSSSSDRPALSSPRPRRGRCRRLRRRHGHRRRRLSVGNLFQKAASWKDRTARLAAAASGGVADEERGSPSAAAAPPDDAMWRFRKSVNDDERKGGFTPRLKSCERGNWRSGWKDRMTWGLREANVQRGSIDFSVAS